MLSDLVLEVEAVSKHYEIYTSPRKRFVKLFYDMFQIDRPVNQMCHTALKQMNFTLCKGEVLGILGRNGAGKSTLLQIISGTLRPSAGKVRVYGKLAALLELGAGFHPEFTGRENIMTNAAILGLSAREIEHCYADILQFADIGDFINRPVKTYSSGMFMRLAFAVATSVHPDVLIIDEALAVGDVKFQAKCFRRLETLRQRGTSIILVTHSTEQVTRHCTKAMIIEAGEVYQFGDPKVVANTYLDLLFAGSSANTRLNIQQNTNKSVADSSDIDSAVELRDSKYYNQHEHRWGNGDAQIYNFTILYGDELNPSALGGAHPYQFRFSVRFHRPLQNIIVGFTLKTIDGITVYGRNTENEVCHKFLQEVDKEDVVDVEFSILPALNAGDYLISLGVVQKVHQEIIPLERRYDAIHITVHKTSASYGIVDLHDAITII